MKKILTKEISIKNTFNQFKEAVIKSMGKKALTNNEITKVCKKLFKRKYIGTYAQDDMPLGLEGYMIVNVDVTGQPGSHWVALILDKHHCYVYDSFGRKTEDLLPILEKKLEDKHIIAIDADHKPEQFGLLSEICGQLCISWLLTCEKYTPVRVVKVI